MENKKFLIFYSQGHVQYPIFLFKKRPINAQTYLSIVLPHSEVFSS